MNAPAPEVKVKRVVAGILVRGDEILCCQRAASDPMPFKWEFPGGKIEPNETPEDALRRELTEELGIFAEIGPLVADLRHSYTPGVMIELSFFRVERWSGAIKNIVFADLHWVTRSELPQLDFLAADRELVQEIAAGRVL
jgi:8-oxo-dGTP diphosphatase